MKKSQELLDEFLYILAPFTLDKRDWMHYHGYEAALCGMRVCEKVVKSIAQSDKFEGHGSIVSPERQKEMDEWYTAWHELSDIAAANYHNTEGHNVIIKYNKG